MKKFFSKLPVLITFAVVTLVALIVTIVVGARPVTTGMTYSGTYSQEVEGQKMSMDYSIKFKNAKEVSITYVARYMDGEEQTDEQDEPVTIEYYYFLKGDYAYFIYKNQVEDYTDALEEFTSMDEDDLKELREYGSAAKVSAFKASIEKYMSIDGFDLKATCGGAVALVVVFSVLAAVACAGTTLSVVYYVGNKKSGKKAA